MSQELYERMISGLTPKLKAAPGFIAHAGASIPGGWEVTEIWESLEAHENWMKETVMPAAQAGGMAPPSILTMPAHTVIVK